MTGAEIGGSEVPRSVRGRPRAAGAEERILTAALEEYAERGWSGFTVDAVARRAGVGKSTVYLRWSDKDALLTDAVTQHAVELVEVDTGSLAGDLRQLALDLSRHLHTTAGWAALRVTFDHASASDRLGDFAEAVTGVHGPQVDEICRRAIARGEMIADFPSGAVTEALYGAAMVNALSQRLEDRADTEADIEARADQVVAMVLRGIATG